MAAARKTEIESPSPESEGFFAPRRPEADKERGAVEPREGSRPFGPAEGEGVHPSQRETKRLVSLGVQSPPGFGRLHVACDLLAGGEPDARLRLHVLNQLVEVTHRRVVPGHVRM